MVKGIDISQFNNPKEAPIDWGKIKANPDINFIYIKACEGINSPDKKLKENVVGAKSTGKSYGFYHFPTFNNLDVIQDATAEAHYFLTLTADLGATEQPFLDIEKMALNLTQERLLLWVEVFLSKLEEKGYKPIIYGYTAFLDSHLPKNHTLGRYPLWLAQYPWDVKNPPLIPTAPKFPAGYENYKLRLPVGWTKASYWQVSGQGVLDGIKTYVDLNLKF